MTNFFHRLFNPHCESCEDERRESLVCSTCEVLKIELARVQLENQQLLDKLLEEPKIDIPEIKERYEPIKPKMIPWSVRRQHLEAEDRETAKLQKKVVEELEKDMDIKDAS